MDLSLLLLLLQKRPVPFDSPERFAAKRQRPAEHREQRQQQPAANGLLNNRGHSVTTPSLNPSFHTKTEFQRTTDHPEGHSGFPLMHKQSGSSDAPASSESREQQSPKVNSGLQPQQAVPERAHQQLGSGQHRKKKSKKHKDKERERLKDSKAGEWFETSPDLKQKPNKLDSKTL